MAWACLGTNLLVLPGLGSIIAKRRVGYAQIGLAATGFALSLVFVGAVFNRVFEDGTLWPGWGPVRWGVTGLTLVAGSWIWALITSLKLLRQTRQPPVIEHRGKGG